MPGLRSLFLLLALAPVATHAYVRTMASSGVPLSWLAPSIALRANPTNISGLSAAQVSSMLGDAFAAWQLPGSRVGFGYSQSSSFTPVSRSDGLNSVYFTSAGGRHLDYGVVALTEVLYYVANGQLAEADMVFNDNQFLFTANPGDTGKVISGRTAIYLRDVATHEAGHVLGLDHSLVNQSSLVYTAFSGQYNLSKDDESAARTLYGGSDGGSLSGLVSGTNGGIFGAHVTAINLLTGKVEAGGLAASNGGFRVGDLPAGRYAVMVEPFGTDSSSVSAYYQNVDHHFCGSSLFRRRIYSACDSQGIASVLGVSAGSDTGLGTVAPSCSAMTNPGGPPNSIATARELSNRGGAGWGSMHPGDVHYYRVRNVSGALSARVMSYSLYSPLDAKVTILDSAGNAVAGATSIDNVENPGPGGVVNYDSLATATVASGDYLLQITSASTRIPASKFSAGYDLVDYDAHYLVALAVNGDIAPTGDSDMSSCVSVRNRVQSASFTPFVAPPARERSSGCGTIATEGKGPFSGGMMQVLVTAAFLQALFLATRLRRRLLPRSRR